MTVRSDQYGAFGALSRGGFARFHANAVPAARNWGWFSGILLANDEQFRWLMDVDDGWPNPSFQMIEDAQVVSDTNDMQKRTSSFRLDDFGDLGIDLVQETPAFGYNFVQRYTFNNPGNSPLSLKLLWFNDLDLEFTRDAADDRVGFVIDEMPRAYFIEQSDIGGAGHPGVDDRDQRISAIADMGSGVEFDGYLGAGIGSGASYMAAYLATNQEILEQDRNSIQAITAPSGFPTGENLDEDGDGFIDAAMDVSGAMQFSLNIPAQGAVTLGFDYVGGSLRNAEFRKSVIGDFDGNGALDSLDIDDLSARIRGGGVDPKYDLDGNGSIDQEDRTVWVTQLKRTYYGDANLDGEFSSGDFVAVFTAGQYEDDVPLNSTWSTADWNGGRRKVEEER